jgi:hypothetical protein
MRFVRRRRPDLPVPAPTPATTQQVTAVRSNPQESFDWAANTFYSMDWDSDDLGGQYFALRPDSLIRKDDTLLVLGRTHDQERTAKVQEIIDVRPIKLLFDQRGFSAVYNDKALWSKVGWYWDFRGPDEPATVARLSKSGILAVANLGKDVIVLDGPNEKPRSPIPAIPKPEADAIVQSQQRLLDGKSCMAADSLVRAVRYGPSQGHEIVELFVGKAVYLDKPIDGSTMGSIDICQAFVVDGMLQRQLEFSRSSSREERVDTAPPTLNDDSWYEVADHTLGYLSLDGGNRWNQAIENGGFEGINFKIESVQDGRQVLQMFHYTPH